MADPIEVGPPVRLGGRPVSTPVRTGWDAPEAPRGPVTRLDDLTDVEVTPGATGVLTRDEPGDPARFVPLPDPPPLPGRHVQQTPATRWQIVHRLGWRPAVVVHDSDGHEHRPERVEHPVPGQVTEIVFGMPMTGTADPS